VGEEIRAALDGSVLLRCDVAFVRDVDEAFLAATHSHPQMVVVDCADTERAAKLVHRLRGDPRTCACSIVLLSGSLGNRELLGSAGANTVLLMRGPLSQWNQQLAPLLGVPRRREARLPVRFEFWSGGGADAQPTEGTALNLSVHGVLLESATPIDLGARIDLTLSIPGVVEASRAFGAVVRIARSEERPRRGIEFLILHGSARSDIEAFVARRG
jgi:hypothetical protein